jgi:protein-arginine kinase activator protein McsA
MEMQLVKGENTVDECSWRECKNPATKVVVMNVGSKGDHEAYICDDCEKDSNDWLTKVVIPFKVKNREEGNAYKQLKEPKDDTTV